MKSKKDFFTLPNMLSLFRMSLIPLFVWLYSKANTALAGCAVLLVSGLTDILDGYIARKFSMVSDMGKILDPIADKLTQAVTLFCLAERFPAMLTALFILFAKELCCGALCLMAIKKSGQVRSSDWHGKLCTVLLYTMLTLHLLWGDIPAAVSRLTVSICSVAMLFSFVLYAVENLSILIRRKNLP